MKRVTEKGNCNVETVNEDFSVLAHKKAKLCEENTLWHWLWGSLAIPAHHCSNSGHNRHPGGLFLFANSLHFASKFPWFYWKRHSASLSQGRTIHLLHLIVMANSPFSIPFSDLCFELVWINAWPFSQEKQFYLTCY